MKRKLAQFSVAVLLGITSSAVYALCSFAGNPLHCSNQKASCVFPDGPTGNATVTVYTCYTSEDLCCYCRKWSLECKSFVTGANYWVEDRKNGTKSGYVCDAETGGCRLLEGGPM
jgi:hypothetical protein